MVRIRSLCCACAANGSTAAPLTNVMKSRRLIASPKAQDKAPYQVEPVMSAFGQKQTYAVHQPMSALPPKATAKADSRKRPCLLYPQKRTCAVRWLMSALGQ